MFWGYRVNKPKIHFRLWLIPDSLARVILANNVLFWFTYLDQCIQTVKQVSSASTTNIRNSLIESFWLTGQAWSRSDSVGLYSVKNLVFHWSLDSLEVRTIQVRFIRAKTLESKTSTSIGWISKWKYVKAKVWWNRCQSVCLSARFTRSISNENFDVIRERSTVC